MKLYFSGVSSPVEADMLGEAGITTVLVDPFDYPHASGFDFVAMDSGAYRSFKKGIPLPPVPYGAFDFVVSPDVIGDPEASRQAWENDRSKIPVWHWGEKMELLRWYLSETDGIVGIGGCVMLMRERSKRLWGGLPRIVEKYSGRFHIFGANWIDLLMVLAPNLHSADTSKWLDGARYGEVLGDDMQPVRKAELGRKERCVCYARKMDEYFNGGTRG